jgi:aspartate/methionine/tyrosine aminotransferase
MKLPPAKMARFFAKHEFTAPYLFCPSDCESFSVEDLLKFEPQALEAMLSLRLGYTDSPGSLELRTQIASLYNNVSSDEILVHAGAEEAIFNFMNVALDPGDEIIVHSPYYQSLGEVAHGIGARVIEWEAGSKNAWELDLRVLEDTVTEQTKLVVVNFPHNPTGFLPTVEFVSELSRLSEERGFLVFSDEIFRGLEYDPGDCIPAFVELNDRAISLGGMSKTYGLAGLRIGWIATHNKDLIRNMAQFKDYTSMSNSTTSEFLATLALRNRDAIIERNLNIIRNNLNDLNAFFHCHPQLFNWIEPKAGPIAFPKYLGGAVEDFCQRLLQQQGVLIYPGTLIGKGFNCFRIGFGRANMAESLQRLEQFIEYFSHCQ